MPSHPDRVRRNYDDTNVVKDTTIKDIKVHVCRAHLTSDIRLLDPSILNCPYCGEKLENNA